MWDKCEMPANIIYWAVVVIHRNGKAQEWRIAKTRAEAVCEVPTMPREDWINKKVEEVRIAGVYNDPTDGPTRWFTEDSWVVGLVKV